MAFGSFKEKAENYLNFLCGVRPNRRTGSKGNLEAVEFFQKALRPWGFDVDASPFGCLDYESGRPVLSSGGKEFEIMVSPYSLGCNVSSELACVSNREELEKSNCRGKILLLRGEICSEQLMPKNFQFYNPDHHKRIYSLLERKQPSGIITATGSNPEMVGALNPYPMICDGDFNIPCAYCNETEGEKIAAGSGGKFSLVINSRRIPAFASNVVAAKNSGADRKIVFCAHIDAYENSPGASDNASGTVVLMILAEMLKDYEGGTEIEIFAVNGEDHYSAGGEMDYLKRYKKDFGRTILAVNIDDAGYKKGKTAYSFYNYPDELKRKAVGVFNKYPGLIEGKEWYQSDHMVFAMNGVPSAALTSEKAGELMAEFTHTGNDTPDIVDCVKLVEAAEALRDLAGIFQEE